MSTAPPFVPLWRSPFWRSPFWRSPFWRRVTALPAAVLVAAVRVYQWTLRPVIGANCRFEPSCSHYAIEALRRHGAARGAALSAWRVLRCNPWTAGGHDPVPPCSCDAKVLAR